jgi:hypothetical protein
VLVAPRRWHDRGDGGVGARDAGLTFVEYLVSGFERVRAGRGADCLLVEACVGLDEFDTHRGWGDGCRLRRMGEMCEVKESRRREIKAVVAARARRLSSNDKLSSVTITLWCSHSLFVG